MSSSVQDLEPLIAGLPDDQQKSIISMVQKLITPPPPLVPTDREIAADHRDLVRTLNKVLKPQTPSPYKGDHDADACQNFIDNQEEYYTVVQLTQTNGCNTRRLTSLMTPNPGGDPAVSPSPVPGKISRGLSLASSPLLTP